MSHTYRDNEINKIIGCVGSDLFIYIFSPKMVGAQNVIIVLNLGKKREEGKIPVVSDI